jgi:hypothetical protein
LAILTENQCLVRETLMHWRFPRHAEAPPFQAPQARRKSRLSEIAFSKAGPVMARMARRNSVSLEERQLHADLFPTQRMKRPRSRPGRKPWRPGGSNIRIQDGGPSRRKTAQYNQNILIFKYLSRLPGLHQTWKNVRIMNLAHPALVGLRGKKRAEPFPLAGTE